MASSSSVFPPSPAFSSQFKDYDVFLSFREADTCQAFVDHLYEALVRKGISTCKDDARLPRRAPSSPIAIVIFSENFAESRSCLDILAHIMRCRKETGVSVMPIFYYMDPDVVRNQKWEYGEAFAKHEWLENKTKVESWRKALVDASGMSGWDVNGPDSEVIKQIVDDISEMLYPLTFGADENLIGLEVRTHPLKSKLQLESGGTRLIGIVGVEGGGKTTLASSLYNRISSMFEGCCFIRNIRERSKKINGLLKLQKKIIFGVLKKERVEVGSIEEGRRVIINMLFSRKVLIVLDDVNHLDQLEALAGSQDWFGEGSRIIITTRYEHLLKAHRVDVIHNITLLNNNEAFKLLCKHSYLADKLMGYELRSKDVVDYELLSKDVVDYAGGLPLALEVLGNFLRDKDINVWRSVLARLKQIPYGTMIHIHDLVESMNNIGRRVQATAALPENFPSTEENQQISYKDVEHLKIPFQKLTLATNNFSEEYIIAKGGFGLVYKARYEHDIVALKRLDLRFGQGHHEFNMELIVLSAYVHKNLVSLVGFCKQDGEKILVYKYESNGSLDKHIRTKDLSWIQRVRICLDAARGLKYLHDDIGTHHKILHCDIKSSNILLDENFTAKISDFGLSKIALSNVPHSTLISRVCGTMGYCDPEYYKHGILTQKSDVYSFGVVMFEVLCGKLVGISKHLDESFSAELAQNHYGKETLDEIIDPNLLNQMNSASLATFSAIAHQCLKCPGRDRPTMSVVVEELEKAFDYQRVVSP